jgi:hypothetical protein
MIQHDTAFSITTPRSHSPTNTLSNPDLISKSASHYSAKPRRHPLSTSSLAHVPNAYPVSTPKHHETGNITSKPSPFLHQPPKFYTFSFFLTTTKPLCISREDIYPPSPRPPTASNKTCLTNTLSAALTFRLVFVSIALYGGYEMEISTPSLLLATRILVDTHLPSKPTTRFQRSRHPCAMVNAVIDAPSSPP